MTKQVRTFNEREARAALALTLLQLSVVKKQLARWMLDKRRPTLDDMHVLALACEATEAELAALAKLPSSTGHTLDFSIGRLTRQMERLSQS